MWEIFGMWDSPIYRFRIPEDGNNSQELKEIVIDVTGSAPTFTKPSNALKKVLTEIFNSKELKPINSVLEFGAAKLKNIPFILDHGKTVSAVDFEKITQNSFTKEMLTKCGTYGNKFQKMIFPKPFISDSKKFDLALLINVLPVMPVFSERLFVLKLMYEKIKKGKYLLWVAQREGSYKKIREKGKNTCGDGIWMGKTHRYKTFYKYHDIKTLDELMGLFGFKLIKRYSVGDDARLYEKTKHVLFSDIISAEKIRKYIPIDETIENPESIHLKKIKEEQGVKEVLPNPEPLSIESLYIEKIKKIPTGTKNAELYHRVVSHALSRIFRNSLRNMEIKVPIDKRIKIIDTVFTNCAKDGFFSNLKNKFECSYPIVEMKNVTGAPTNVELDQLNGRLNTKRGDFGLQVCRTVDDEKIVYDRCKTYLDGHCLLFLTDKDIFELLEYSRDDAFDEISDFMDNKLRRLIF